jgi:capsid portal protein
MSTEAVKTPDPVVPETRLVSRAFILGNGTVVSAEEFQTMVKAAVASAPMGEGTVESTTSSALRIVEPPYNPAILERFSESDEINARCIATKVTDALGRPYRIGRKSKSDPVDREVLDAETEVIKEFIATCNRFDGFEGVWYQAGVDFEAIGWACVEVIRALNRRIVKINHIRSSRIRVIEGFTGFIETLNNGKKRYYQPFGDKVVSAKKTVTGIPEPFNLSRDGNWRGSSWNLRNRNTFEPTSNLSEACSEILYIPKFHPKSVYYGVPDYMSAIGYIMVNANIRDYFLQFFDHNTIPQYAIVIKGADLTPEVKQLIMAYFSRDVKGSTHKTLIIPIPAAGEIDVTFEKLETDIQASDYEAVRKSNQSSIMISHGVNPAIIGINDAANLGSGKGTAQMENYRERIVTPLQTRWASVINRMFEIGLGVSQAGIVFDPLSTEERSELLKDDIEAMANGLLTLNEVRERNNLGGPIEGGDKYTVRSGNELVPLFQKPPATTQPPA